MGDGRWEKGDEAVLVVKGEERQAVGYWAEGLMLEPWKDRDLEP